MKVLVTGATGFIGRYVVRHLEVQGHEVALFVHKEPAAWELRAENTMLIHGDLDHLSAVTRLISHFLPAVCIHLAWEGIPDYSARISKLNLDRSVNLIDFLTEQTACRKIIVSGSCFEYGKTSGECLESDIVQTTSYIAWAKKAIYDYLSLRCEQKAVAYVWFRLFYVYGLGQRREALIPSIVNALLKGEVPHLQNPHHANDFIYVQDVARAFDLAVQKEVPSGIYNLGSGFATRVGDLLEIVKELMGGTQEEVKRDVKNDLSAASSVCFWANIQKVKQYLGWQPQYSLRDGIQQFLQMSDTLTKVGMSTR